MQRIVTLNIAVTYLFSKLIQVILRGDGCISYTSSLTHHIVTLFYFYVELWLFCDECDMFFAYRPSSSLFCILQTLGAAAVTLFRYIFTVFLKEDRRRKAVGVLLMEPILSCITINKISCD